MAAGSTYRYSINQFSRLTISEFAQLWQIVVLSVGRELVSTGRSLPGRG